MNKLLLPILFVPILAISARAQTVVPSACPEGYVHEGADCVLVEGEHVYRYPFRDFARGGRFFGGRTGFHRAPAPRGRMLRHR